MRVFAILYFPSCLVIFVYFLYFFHFLEARSGLYFLGPCRYCIMSTIKAG